MGVAFFVCALDTLLVCFFGKSGRGMHIRHIGPAPQNLNNHIYWRTPNRFSFLFTKRTTLVKNQHNFGGIKDDYFNTFTDQRIIWSTKIFTEKIKILVGIYIIGFIFNHFNQHFDFKNIQGWRKWGAGGVYAPPQILAAQLTISQPQGGRFCPPITSCPPSFQI